jgi:hypothetical protein
VCTAFVAECFCRCLYYCFYRCLLPGDAAASISCLLSLQPLLLLAAIASGVIPSIYCICYPVVVIFAVAVVMSLL